MSNLLTTLRGHRFNFDTEAELQDAIEKVLKESGLYYAREVRLGEKDRIDFLLGPVGIEVKTDSPTNAVLRQLHRYAQYVLIAELVLITNRAKHLSIPRQIGGKPVTVIFTGSPF